MDPRRVVYLNNAGISDNFSKRAGQRDEREHVECDVPRLSVRECGCQQCMQALVCYYTTGEDHLKSMRHVCVPVWGACKVFQGGG